VPDAKAEGDLPVPKQEEALPASDAAEAVPASEAEEAVPPKWKRLCPTECRSGGTTVPAEAPHRLNGAHLQPVP
jgi:hypothetical protein